MRKRILYSGITLFLGVLAAAAIGCQPLENSARDAAAASQGFIQQAQQNHLAECQANPTKPFPCVMINQAVGAQNLLVDAVELYCGYPVRPGVDALKALAGQPCARNKSYSQSLANAVKSLNAVIADYKLAAGSAK